MESLRAARKSTLLAHLKAQDVRRAILFFAGLTALFYAPLLWGEAFLPVGFLYRTPIWYNSSVPLRQFDLYDTIIVTYPWLDLLGKSLAQGEFPYWNPYNFGGHPIAFNGQSGFLYPPRLLLCSLFPAWLAHGLSLAGHTFVAGLACWWLARRLGLGMWPALMCGTAWMFNPYVMGWLQYDVVNCCASYIPLSLLATERCRRDWSGAGALGLSIGLLLVCGHLQFVLYSLITIALVGGALFLGKSSPAITWIRAAVGGLLGILLSLPCLLPSAYYMSLSQRPTLSLDFLYNSYRQLLASSPPSFLFSQAYGDGNAFAVRRIMGAGEFINPEISLSFGAPVLMLGLTALLFPGPGRRLMGLALAILIVPATPLYGVLHLLPGMDRINSTRLTMVIHFLVVLAAGFALQRLAQAEFRKKVLVVGSGLLVLGTGWVAWACGRSAPLAVRTMFSEGRVRLPKRELFLSDQEFVEATLRGFDQIYSWSNPAFFLPLLGLAVGLACLVLNKFPQRVLVVALALELLVTGRALNPHHDHHLLYPSNPTLETLGEAGLERVLGVGTIKPDTLLPYAINDLAGYDSFYPRHSAYYLAYLMKGVHDPEAQLPAQVFPIKNHQSRLVDAAGVRYLVAYPGQTLEGETLVQAEPLPVFENPDRLPRAYLVNRFEVIEDIGTALKRLDSPEFDLTGTVILPASIELPDQGEPGSAEIVEYKLNEVRLTTRSDVPALLVLSDSFLPGWQATVDGQEVEVYRPNVMFRGVLVPAGEHQVRFVFRPHLYPLGLALGGLGLLGILLLVLIGRRLNPEQAQD